MPCTVFLFFTAVYMTINLLVYSCCNLRSNYLHLLQLESKCAESGSVPLEQKLLSVNLHVCGSACATSYSPHKERRDLWEILENFLFIASFFFFFCTANTSAVWLSVLLESVLLSLGACHSSPCHCLCILSFNSIHVKVCVCVFYWGFLGFLCLTFISCLFPAHYKMHAVTGCICWSDFL